jgi:signal peptidase I
MPRRGEPSDPDDDEVEDDLDLSDDMDEEDDEERPTSKRSRPPPRRRNASRPVRPWTISDLDEDDDDANETRKGKKRKAAPSGEGFWASLHRPVFFRARDSWYFEPLVALAIIILLLVSLFAYTGNWPPIYVVESGSMQHGTADHVGLINAGDLVLVKQVPSSTVVTYVAGEESGYSTYGEYGDVILYHPNGFTDTTPVIHRAILYLVWNSAAGDFSAPALAPLPCGSEPGARYSVAGTPNGCGWSGLLTTITLYDVGWRNATVSIPLGSMGHYSGFITMGDNNTVPGSPPQGTIDQTFLSGLVKGGWIIGVARGMVPWVGAFKLLVDGNAGKVPSQSWQFLALTIAAIVLGSFGLHYLFRVEGIEDPRRLEEEKAEARGRAEEDEEGPQWEDHPKGSRWKGLREWLATSGEDEEEPAPVQKHVKKHTRAAVVKPTTSPRARGRPRPAVRKSKGLFHRKPEQKASRDSDDDTL